jgi:hypothetical protein
MPDESSSRDTLSLGYEIFIAIVSVLSVVNMAIAYLPGMDLMPQT